MSAGKDAIIVTFSKEQVRQRKLAHFLKRLGEPKAAVEYDPMDLIGLIQQNFGPLNAMMLQTAPSNHQLS